MPPSISEPVAAELDKELWSELGAATGFTMPRGEEEGGLSLRIPVVGLDKHSFQEWAANKALWLGSEEPGRTVWTSLSWLPGDCTPLHGRFEPDLPRARRVLGRA